MRTDLIYFIGTSADLYLLLPDDCFLLHADLCQLTLFVREDPFARRVWTTSSRTLTVFILEDPVTTLGIRAVRADLPSNKRHRRNFSQWARTIFV
jgi:hypothetical protein